MTRKPCECQPDRTHCVFLAYDVDRYCKIAEHDALKEKAEALSYALELLERSGVEQLAIAMAPSGEIPLDAKRVGCAIRKSSSALDILRQAVASEESASD